MGEVGVYPVKCPHCGGIMKVPCPILNKEIIEVYGHRSSWGGSHEVACEHCHNLVYLSWYYKE